MDLNNVFYEEKLTCNYDTGEIVKVLFSLTILLICSHWPMTPRDCVIVTWRLTLFYEIGIKRDMIKKGGISMWGTRFCCDSQVQWICARDRNGINPYMAYCNWYICLVWLCIFQRKRSLMVSLSWHVGDLTAVDLHAKAMGISVMKVTTFTDI